MNKLHRRKAILHLARERYEEEGTLEIDDDAPLSECPDENGTYVQAWVWVDFAGTALDKEKGNQ